MGHRERRRWLRHLAHPAMLFSVAILIAGGLAFSMMPPPPRGLEAPPDEFSSERAAVILRGLLAESRPHVAGSPLNRMVAERIVNFLTAAGYEPEIQSLFHCNPTFGTCGQVENIIAVKPGSDGGRAVLVTAHYDSSWSGPGAGDDGAGTAAVLELARMVAEYREFRNDVIFLLTDGEELGLIGAHAFAENHPLFGKVSTVINLEARGVTGPSTMFETGEGNRSLIRVLSKSVEWPVANSLAYEIYKRMPNDSDFSVYRERGAGGLNFAFTGGVALYHSQFDDVNHLDFGSLQHHGQNAWSLIQALADRDIERLQSREDAAYIDVFSLVLWHYPVSIASGLTLVLAVLVLAGIVLRCRREISVSAIVWAIVAQIVVAILLFGGAWLLNWPLGRMVDTHAIEHPMPWVARIGLLSLCGLAIWITGKIFAHRITFGAATLVCWGSFVLLALWLDFNLPAASFLALVPLAAFLIGMLLDLLRWKANNKLVMATLFGFTAAAYMAFYHFYALDVVLPFSQSQFKVLPLLFVVLPFLPPWFGRFDDPIPDWRPAFVIGGMVVAAALLHQLVPGFSEDRPRGMNMVYRQVPGEENALIYLESPQAAVDPVFAEARGFVPMDLPSRFASANVAPYEDRPTMNRPAVRAASLDLPGVSMEMAEDTSIEGSSLVNPPLQLLMQTPPGTEQVVIVFPESVQVLEARIDGVIARDEKSKRRDGRRPRAIQIAYPSGEPHSVDLRLANAGEIEIAVTTRYALPESIVEEYRDNWPRTARQIFHGSRAEVVQEFSLDGNRGR
jgi:hypothetical protein